MTPQINALPGSSALQGNASNIQLRTTPTGIQDAALIGLQDLFTRVAPTSGGNPIVINSAQLHLFSRGGFNGDTGSTVSVFRVTSDWLINAAGTNENDVSGNFRENSSASRWAGGTTLPFSTLDYAGGVPVSRIWSPGSDVRNSFDVTGLVSTIYATGSNEGFAVLTSSTSQLGFRTSEQANATTPVLEIDFDYVPVPEPAGLAILGLGSLAILGRRRG